MRQQFSMMHAMDVLAKVGAVGAVAAAFAIAGHSPSYAAPSLAAVSTSRGPAPADTCSDNPNDPACPPIGPTDIKCTTAAWQATAWCAGGPYARTFPTPLAPPACPSSTPGCPGWVNPVPETKPVPPPHHGGPPPKDGDGTHPMKNGGAPPPAGDHPGAPDAPPPPGDHPDAPPPGSDHSEPAAPPPGSDHSAPVAPAPPVMPPAPAVQAPAPMPVAPAPVVQAPAPVMQAPAPMPVSPPVMVAPASPPSVSTK
jgi:hypothetical protein